MTESVPPILGKSVALLTDVKTRSKRNITGTEHYRIYDVVCHLMPELLRHHVSVVTRNFLLSVGLQVSSLSLSTPLVLS